MGCEVVKVALGQVFLRVLQLPLSVSFYQCSILIFLYMLFLPEGQRAKPRNLPKCNSLSEIGEHWIENNFHFFWRLRQISNIDLASSCLYVRPSAWNNSAPTGRVFMNFGI